ncbi:MAG: NAD-dependent protein deacylase [bacterium]|nr:NAD-dependent protein deacylase [bacterium]MCM1375266.1 NAD-dependent protein deacylase [Muribaculum sp.]MCM1409818.1 NAD-dependent protein deacylase [Lachnospiraceae bacterium]
MSKEINTFVQIIRENKHIVFFGGAGVSTESGIPDFRSVDGLYNQQYDYPPETILSHSFYRRNPAEFYRFYRNKMLFPDAKPNMAHRMLARLEELGKLDAVITQNIDGLHQAAGSRKVYELHGSVLRNYCECCHAFYDLPYIMESEGVPRCSKCDGSIKPDVVLYEEGLDQDTLSGAVSAIRQANVLIIGGTSLAVYPAAGLIDYFQGDHLIVINMSPTPRDRYASLCIQEPIGQVFSALEDILRPEDIV